MGRLEALRTGGAPPIVEQLMRRTQMAERHHQRTLNEKRRVDFRRRVRPESVHSRLRGRNEAWTAIKASRRALKEDWELGPLAPRRDQEKGWGTISRERLQLDVKHMKPEELEARAAWAGGMQNLCLRKGDRVAIIEGIFKGKIATIASIHRRNATVSFAGGALMANVAIPEFLDIDRAAHLFASTVPISAVRLVYPLPRPDGSVRDVLIPQLRPVDIVTDKVFRTITWDRVVPGLNISIPWPGKNKKARNNAEDVELSDPKDCVPNSHVNIVEERTYVPRLLTPPMPEQVVDELRNRYSAFRTRHEAEYVAAKAAEWEAEEARKRAAAESMVTPLQELHKKRREELRARPMPELDEEMLAKIGEVVVKTREMQRPVPTEPPKARFQVSESTSGSKHWAQKKRQAAKARRRTALEGAVQDLSVKDLGSAKGSRKPSVPSS